jgi:hypothetical protein
MRGWNMGLPADPSVVGTSTSGLATSYPFQRKTFYANGRFWVFYSDGTNMVYCTSTDGSTWTSATTVRAAIQGILFSVWFDGTYLHYAYAYASSIYYRRGIPNSDGSITWSAAEQTVSTKYNYASYPMISVDSNGYAWIGYIEYTGSYWYPYVIKSGNNDGTWGTTPSGFPYQLSTTSNTDWKVSVVPLTSGKMLAVYALSNAIVKARRWTGSAWDTEVATTSAISQGYYYSAVAQGDDVHLTFHKATTYDIIYVKYTYSTNSFGTETTLVAGATSSSAPVISINPSTNDLYVFAATKTTGTPSDWTADHIYYIKYTASSGTWGSWTDWIDETNELLYHAARLSCFYKSYDSKIGLVYMTKTASPYNVKFAYLSLVAAVTVTVTDSVGLSDAALCNKTFTVSDSASLSDAVLCHKTFAVSDSVGLTETLIGLPMASKIVADAVSLADVVSVYVGAVLKIVEDSVGLSDAVYRNKALIISDTVSVLDQVFRHKPLVSISDVLTLAEVVAVSKVLAVADYVSLSDVAKVLKQLRVSDSIMIVDAVQVPSRILAVLDSIGLSDVAKVGKALIVSDQIALVEVVYAAPVRKTKLFLVIGNLAVQLTGG